MLTGKQIAEKKVISNYKTENIQMQGIDLRLRNLYALFDYGVIPREGKTEIPKSQLIDLNEPIMIEPGYYEVEFEEGCSIPDNVCMKPMTRSSVVRCGGEIRSGLFDAGFATDHIGAFLKVERTIVLERGSRLAQAVCFTSDTVQNLYNGQFQGDCQRS